jgi:hypothetical protein
MGCTTGIQAFNLELYSISDPSSLIWRYFPVSLENEILSSVPHPGGGTSMTGSSSAPGAEEGVPLELVVMMRSRRSYADHFETQMRHD